MYKMKKHLVIILIGLMIFVMSGRHLLAQTAGQGEAQAIEKTKTKINRLGVGEKARAQIKLRNGQKLNGYVSSAGASDFSFTERGSGKTTTVAYGDVIQVKKPGGLSKGTKIAIAAGIGGAIVISLIANHIKNCLLGCR
jgi:hypothetical protein